jgi:hypothetical protein
MSTDGLDRDFGELAKKLTSEKSSNCQKEGFKYNTATILKMTGWELGVELIIVV